MGVEKDPFVDEMAEEETALTRDVLERLSEPFPEEAIGWKPQAFYPKDKPTKALAVPHITSRNVMDRLDEVVGPAGWQQDFEFIPGIKAAKVMLTILGITKCDIGFVAGDDDAAVKGSVSDGLKRAAVLFGIGRYLYEVEGQWVKWDGEHRKFAEQPHLKFKNGPKASPPKKAERQPEEPQKRKQQPRAQTVNAPTKFWTYVNEHDIPREEADAAVEEAGGDFGQALARLLKKQSK